MNKLPFHTKTHNEMRSGIFLFLCLLVSSCSKEDDLGQTNPWKLSDQAIKDRICSKVLVPAVWVRSSEAGLAEITFFSDKVSAGYKINRPTGVVQEYSGLTFSIYRDKQSKKVSIQFFKKGLELHSEPMTSLSVDTWRNDADSTVYILR